jgi:Glycosyltransferase 61
MSRSSDVLRRLGSARSHGWSSLFGSRPMRTVPAAVVEGSELIHLGGGETVPCPGIESMLLAPAAKRLGLGSTSLALPPAKVHVFRDVRLCPGSRLVTTQSGRVVAESITSDMPGRVELCEEELRRDPIELEGTIALYRSPWKPQFHTLVDHLPRAALLAQPAMRRIGRLTLVHDGPLTDIEAHLLPRLLGRQIQLLEVEPGTPLVADRVVLPGYVTRPFTGAIPSWYRRWIDREAAAVGADTVDAPTGGRRRYFVERAAGGNRKVSNRDQLQEVLDRHQITTIRPSEMTARERIVCFRDAELVIGVLGSGMSNLVFSRSTRVLELLPGAELLPHFFYLSAAKGLPYQCVPAVDDGRSMSAEERLHHDVFVDARALDDVLAAMG